MESLPRILSDGNFTPADYTWLASIQLYHRRKWEGQNKTQVLEEKKTFRGVLRASALALSLMDLSLGPAKSII